jgi:hypothetical protein
MELMMTKSALALAVLLAACATSARSPEAAPPQAAAAAPGTAVGAATPGEKSAQCVVIQAATEREGLAAEGRWLHEHYPGWQKTGQSLLMGATEGQRFDQVDILDGKGEKHSVCFDITSFFGKM